MDARRWLAGDDVEEAVAGHEGGVELHGAALVPAQERGLVRLPRAAEVAVPLLGVRLATAGGEHAEEAVAHPRSADQGLQLGGEILVDPVAEGGVVLPGVQHVAGP